MRISDWSSDVCSSDLPRRETFGIAHHLHCLGSNPGTPGDRLRQFQPLEKPTDDAHGKSVTRTNRIDHTINRAGRHAPLLRSDRKSVVQGQSVSVRVVLGGRRISKKKKTTKKIT